MNVKYVIGPIGSLVGIPHYLLRIDKADDPDVAIARIEQINSKQPTTVSVLTTTPIAEMDELFRRLVESIHGTLQGRVVLLTEELPSATWDLFDYVIYRSNVKEYHGTVADEIHLLWDTNDGPLAHVTKKIAQNIPIWVRASPEDAEAALKWIADQDVPLRLVYY